MNIDTLLATIRELRQENERLTADLAHMSEQAGGESCAAYAVENRKLRAELAAMRSQLAQRTMDDLPESCEGT